MHDILVPILVNLIIDIGNTTTKLAVFDKNTLVEVFYDSDRTFNFLLDICREYYIERGIVASVVDIDRRMHKRLQDCAIPWLWLGPKTSLPIKNLYKSPDTLGYDRIAAVVGASEQFPDRDILVIDAGTALTYEFIDSKGCYHGGNISPGMHMRLKALNQYTGKLPLITAEGNTPLLGYDTETAMRSGVRKGMEYEITGYINTLKHKYPELLVFLTGGDDFSFDTSIKNVIFADRFLVLKGLNRILNYNNDKI